MSGDIRASFKGYIDLGPEGFLRGQCRHGIILSCEELAGLLYVVLNGYFGRKFFSGYIHSLIDPPIVKPHLPQLSFKSQRLYELCKTLAELKVSCHFNRISSD